MQPIKIPIATRYMLGLSTGILICGFAALLFTRRTLSLRELGISVEFFMAVVGLEFFVGAVLCFTKTDWRAVGAGLLTSASVAAMIFLTACFSIL